MSSKTKTVPTTSSTTAEIPEFLRPFLQQSAGTASDALGGLEAATSDITSSLPSSGQLSADALAQLEDFIGGTDADRELALKKLRGVAGGRALRDTAFQFNNLQGTPQEAIKAEAVSATPQQTFAELQRGNFIGSEGFNASVDASIRAAKPYIFGGFAKGGGVGASKGGLAQVAMQKAASDSFAQLYGDERNRQLGAANSQVQAEAQRQQAAAQLAQINVAREANRISERMMLGNIGLQERSNQLNAATNLLGTGREEAFGNAAALQSFADIPINAQTNLLNSATSGIPASLIGQNTVGTQQYTNNPAGGALGGALTGAQIGSMIPVVGTGFGAAAGGLLGAFG